MIRLRTEVGKGKMRMEILLGDPKTIKHTLEYVKETSRLDTLNNEGDMGSTKDKGRSGKS